MIPYYSITLICIVRFTRTKVQRTICCTVVHVRLFYLRVALVRVQLITYGSTSGSTSFRTSFRTSVRYNNRVVDYVRIGLELSLRSTRTVHV
jgi:hypothetical protein